jgi:16S rRNA processing protein RimM
MKNIFEADSRKIGYIRKTHGVKGQLMLEFEPHFYDSVAVARCFLIEISGLPVPFFVAENGLEISSSLTARICFDRVDTENYANRLTGKNVYLFEDDIIEQQANEKAFQFINYRLSDQNNNELGIVAGADDFSGNIVLRVLTGESELLISYHSDLLISVDKRRKRFSLRLPEGFNE